MKVFQVLTKKNIKKQRISSLDGLRGLAAICVFLAHVSGRNINLIQLVKFSDSEIGRSGVYLFFVLSSFLLTSQFLKPKTNLNNFALWTTYLKKRFLRIYPLYIVVLLGYLVFWGYSIPKFFNHLFLIQGESCFWTIVVEIKYYFILPAIVYFMINVLNKNTLLVISSSLLVYLLDGALWFSKGSVSSISIIPYLPTFLIGSCAALINSKISDSSLFNKNALKWFLESIALLSMIIIFWLTWFVKDQHGIDSDLDFNFLRFNIPVIYGILWAVVIVSHLWGKGILKRVLTNPLLQFLGAISFGIYLWHIPVLGYLDAHLHTSSSVKFVAIFATTAIVSSLTYFLVEKPFILLGAKKS